MVVAIAVGGLVRCGTIRRAPGTTAPSNWVSEENRRPGTSDWRIAINAYGGVEGYANRCSARVGDSVTLYVTTSAATFHVEAYRMGWYHGLGGRLVWRSADVRGQASPPPTIVAATRTVSTTWKPFAHRPGAADWSPGDYLLKLVSSKGQSYVPLTVRNDASVAPMLVMNAVTTWQAYNDWGGYSLYFGPGTDPATRSTVVSFDRPYDWAVRTGGYPPGRPLRVRGVLRFRRYRARCRRDSGAPRTRRRLHNRHRRAGATRAAPAAQDAHLRRARRVLVGRETQRGRGRPRPTE